MKKLTFLILGVAFGHSLAFSQPCLPEGITFTTQEQIDNFQSDYPGCTGIEGNLTIYGSWDITNLNGLNSLTSVGGDLTINDSHGLPDFTGLDNLQTIGGNVLIKNNINQLSYGGLENLTTIGGNFNTYQYYNTTLINFQGLNSLTSIGGYFFVSIFSALNDFSGLNNLVSIGSDFTIYGISVHSLSGLDNLSIISGHLSVSETPNLEDLMGLQSLSSIGSYMSIFGIPEIKSLNGLNNLTSVGGSIQIYNNDSLASLSGIDNLAAGTIDNLYIYGNHSLSTCEVKSVCDYLAAPTGGVYITDNAPGCNSPEEVIEACLTPVKEVASETNIRIIPNPARDMITISLPMLTGQTQLELFSITGEKLLEMQITRAETQLDLSALPRGIYFVRVSDNMMTEMSKIIKE